MVIRLIKKMPRREIISGGLSAEEYRGLKAGEDTDVNGAAAQYLLSGQYAELIEVAEEIKTDNEEE